MTAARRRAPIGRDLGRITPQPNVTAPITPTRPSRRPPTSLEVAVATAKVVKPTSLHPCGIPTYAVHDRGEHDGQLWITMDYVEGTDAAQQMRDRYPHGMPTKNVLEIVSAIADALDYAHERYLLHRDVKPANILLTDPRMGDRRILLADFRIARAANDINGLTATNVTVGSVAYAAPEQLTGKAVDGRADQYALACTDEV